MERWFNVKEKKALTKHGVVIAMVGVILFFGGCLILYLLLTAALLHFGVVV